MCCFQESSAADFHAITDFVASHVKDKQPVHVCQDGSLSSAESDHDKLFVLQHRGMQTLLIILKVITKLTTNIAIRYPPDSRKKEP